LVFKKNLIKKRVSIQRNVILTRFLSIEIFGEREYRVRPRSSSANWSGLDALTEEEELEYKILMGFCEKTIESKK